MSASRADRVHWVYRCFDKHGEPLYVGCSYDVFGRLRHHRINAVWAGQIAKVKASVHPNRAAAREVERAEIIRLRPAWNLHHRWSQNHLWSRADFDQYLSAMLINGHIPTYRKVHAERVREMRDTRFPDAARAAS